MRLEFSIDSKSGSGESARPEPALVHLEIHLDDLSYEEVHLLADRLSGNQVCRLTYGLVPSNNGGKRKPGRPKQSREVHISSPPEPLRAAARTLLALLTATRENEAEITDAVHQDLRKRFRARHEDQWLEADKRVVVFDRKFNTVLEYEDPLLALDVYIRLIGAAVVSRKDLAILEWSEDGWVKLDPTTLESSSKPWKVPQALQAS